MNSTFGRPASARTGAGQAGLDSSAVRPITPGNPVAGSVLDDGHQTSSLFAQRRGIQRANSPRTGLQTRAPEHNALAAYADRGAVAA